MTPKQRENLQRDGRKLCAILAEAASHFAESEATEFGIIFPIREKSLCLWIDEGLISMQNTSHFLERLFFDFGTQSYHHLSIDRHPEKTGISTFVLTNTRESTGSNDMNGKRSKKVI